MPKKINLLHIGRDLQTLDKIREALKKTGYEVDVTSYKLNDQGVQYLVGRIAVEGAERQTLPDLVIIHQSESEAIPFLKEMIQYHQLRRTPFFILGMRPQIAESLHAENLFPLETPLLEEKFLGLIQKIPSLALKEN